MISKRAPAAILILMAASVGLVSAYIYGQEINVVAQNIIKTYYFVDNNTSDIDSSADKGTQSNFTAQQYVPNSIYDTLTEENTQAIKDYVDSTSNVDSSSDVGTHSDFENEKSNDHEFDTLTESKATETISRDGANQGQSISNTVTFSHTLGYSSSNNRLVVVAAGFENSAGDISISSATYNSNAMTKIVQATTGVTGIVSSVALFYILDSSLPAGSGSYSVTVTCASNPSGDLWACAVSYIGVQQEGPDQYDSDFSGSPTTMTSYLNCDGDGSMLVQANIVGNVGSFTPSSGTTEVIEATDINSASAVCNEKLGQDSGARDLGCTHINMNRGAWVGACWAPAIRQTGCHLDIEVQFTNVADFLPTEKLNIFTGALGDEDLEVDYWNGTGWQNLATDLNAYSCNEYSVSLVSTTFTIRFRGGTTGVDLTQDQWQIDACLLRVEGAGGNEDAVDQQSNVDVSADVGTHSNFTAQQYGPDSIFDTLTEQNSPVITNWDQDYVDSTSNVDGIADKGTHSSFANEQATDSTYDTLTEANTQGTFGEDLSGFSYISTSANYMYGGSYSCTRTGLITSLTFYGMGAFGGYVKGVICDSSGNILTNGISDSLSFPYAATSYSLEWSGSKPSVTSGNTYWVMIIANVAGRLYYYSTTGGSSKTDSTNSYASPTSPTDASSGTYQWRRMFATVTNYELDLEGQWTLADYNDADEYLCIRTGTLGAEALKADVWNGTSWINVIASLTASAWNNVSVSTWLTGSTFTMRFLGGTETADTTQSTWQIDAVLLSTYDSAINQMLDLEVQWTGIPYSLPNENLSIFGGTMGAEDLAVDVWNGTGWENVFSDLSSGWNNQSISAWLTTSNLTIRFKGGNEIGDTTQDQWQIDVALIHIWDDGGEDYQLDLEVQWTNVDYSETNEELCIYVGAGSNNTYSLDAIGGYMIVGDGTPDWGSITGTISFWVKMDSFVQGRFWGQNGDMETRWSGSNLVLDWGGTSSMTSATSFSANMWYFVAIVWDENNNNLFLYVGDEANPPALDSNSLTGTWTSTTPLPTENRFLNGLGGNEPLDGHGDDLRYWNVARSLVELQSDYNITLTGSETNLRSYFKLNNDFDDIGPDNNDGSGIPSYSFSTDVPFTAVGENLKVDVWNGSSWQNVISSLNNGWNNVTVSSYLTSSTFTIRFKGSIETADSLQNMWFIDATLIHVWT